MKSSGTAQCGTGILPVRLRAVVRCIRNPNACLAFGTGWKPAPHSHPAIFLVRPPPLHVARCVNTLNPDTLLAQLNWRYATKKFDATRKITPELWAALEKALILTPSSFGLQPWKFIVITDAALRQKLVPVSWNQTQPVECSHHVVFAARRTVSDADVDHFVESIVATRGVTADSL